MVNMKLLRIAEIALITFLIFPLILTSNHVHINQLFNTALIDEITGLH